MRRIASAFLVVILGFGGLAWAGGEWYNYYEEGQGFMKRGDYDRALMAFQSAVSVDFKDKKQALTYGMNFIEYYPHREMGICYFLLGDMANARRQLEISLAFSKSGRAEDYLAKVGSGGTKPPEVLVRRPPEPVVKPPEPVVKPPEPVVKPPEPVVKPPESAGKVPLGAMTYDPSKVTQVGDRLGIAVMPFQNRGGSVDLGEIVLDKLVTQLVSLHRFKVIERTQLEKVLKEHALGMSGAVDESTAAEVGRVLGVDAILLGAITVYSGNKVGISGRLVNTKTAEVITSKDADVSSSDPDQIRQLAANIAIGIYNDLPLVEGSIVKAELSKFIVDLGSDKGMKKGMKIVAFKEGAEIKNPTTGEILDKEVTYLGELVLQDIQPKMSTAFLVEKRKKGSIVVGDKVVVK